ncbi:MAG: hypothetical protein JSW34_01620 [Candidatus Zixiibacteriota bacterium]|nr:MAG: hypothetical protein JSW34_01620 [candidate division Zixibacteria bacterium]
MKVTISLLSVVLLLSTSTGAQSLEKRHQVGLRAGAWNQVTNVRAEVSADGVTTSVGSTGAFGGVFYGHWLKENLALDISVGGMVADIETEVSTIGVTSKTGYVGQILLGARYYFLESTLSSSVRPFGKAGVGPLIGSQNETRVGTTVTTEERSEMAFGGQVGGGVDFILSRRFALATAVGYNFMTDFSESIGGSTNYSGPEFTISFSYVFGRGSSR